GRAVVVRISQEGGIGEHERRVSLVPERGVVRQAREREEPATQASAVRDEREPRRGRPRSRDEPLQQILRTGVADRGEKVAGARPGGRAGADDSRAHSSSTATPLALSSAPGVSAVESK